MPYFDQTYCLGFYDGKLQNALHQLKYQKRLAYAHGLTSIWNNVMSEHINELEADFLMPVPLSSEKLKLRGFNQSWELAKRVQCGRRIRKSPYILQRHHYFGHQAGSSLDSRRSAIQDMFYIETKYIESLRGQTVVVFDDVMTSGATLNEIARVLKDNGVSRVINWVVLRAARPI